MCRGAEWGVKRGCEGGAKPSGEVTETCFLHQADEDDFPKLFGHQGDLSESPNYALGLREGRHPHRVFAAWEGRPLLTPPRWKEAQAPLGGGVRWEMV